MRKPHSINLGYVTERKCRAECGGHIVIYDRNAGFECDADERWIVMHEPSSIHVAVRNRKEAYDVMYDGVLFPAQTFGVPLSEFRDYKES